MAQSIGIVGAGQAGIVLAAELIRAGCEVTIYSDQTPEGYLAERARPAACLFGDQVDLERELGLNFWDADAPSILGMQIDVCTDDRLVVFSLGSKFERPALAVDQRLKFSHGLTVLGKQGAHVVIGAVSADALDNVAKQHDLTVVTVGRKGFTSLFVRDDARSTFTRPQRQLFMINLSGYIASSPEDDTEIRSALIPGVAEIIWIPFFSKDAGICENVLVEAIPGGPADRFAKVSSADEGLTLLQGLVKEYLPWKVSSLAQAEPTGPTAWLTGAVTPTVRKPVGILPSGRPVLGLGDAVVVNDPLAAQGANNATRMAHFFAQRIVAHAHQPFDASWLEQQFDEFWQSGKLVNELSNTLLEPLAGFQEDLLLAAAHRAELARWFFAGLNDPVGLFPAFGNAQAARKLLAKHGITRGTLLQYKFEAMRRVLGHKIFGSRMKGGIQ